jgi:hypothetical protein
MRWEIIERIRLNQATTSNNRWLDYTVWPVALWASFLNLLNHHDYPLFRIEVGLTLLGLGLIGAFMGIAQRVARPRLSFLFTALFAAVIIDLNSSIELNWFYALWTGLAITGFFAQEALLKVVLAAFSAVLLFQFAALATDGGDPVRDKNQAQNLQSVNSAGSERPAIVHLLLDSYLGLDGMALGPDVYRNLRGEQAAFFTEQGFQIYPRAYSRHTHTTDSLPRMFSYGEERTISRWIDSHHGVPDELPYFADLDRRGYRISAVVPTYIDMCVNQKLTHCRNWDSNDLTSMLGTAMGPLDRATIFAFRLLRLTNAPARLVEAIDSGASDLLGKDRRWTFNRSQVSHLVSIRELDRVIGELADIERGEARFVHLLLPHSPFGLNADCSVKPEAAWLNEHDPSPEANREKAYADQVRCMQGRIARMLEVLDRSQAGREAIVLIHGDHGSRIAPAHPLLDGPELSPREMLMSHSTLFAIRVPGEPAGIIPEAHALDELMANFRERDFASAPRPESAPARVAIASSSRPGREWQPLPSFEP